VPHAERQTVLEAFDALPEADQRQVLRQMAAIGNPPAKYLGAIWILLIVALIVVVIGGGWLVYLLVTRGTDAGIMVGFVSAALGALIGLLAPSPVHGGGGGTTTPGARG